MEYYVMMEYEEKMKKEIKTGFKRFSKCKRRVIYILFFLMVISMLEMIIMLILDPDSLWGLLGSVGVVVFAIALTMIEKKDSKSNYKNHKENHLARLKILEKILNDNNIKTKIQVEGLLEKYKSYTSKKEFESKKTTKNILYLISGAAGILSISFSNFESWGLSFESWILLAIIVVFVVAIIGLSTYLATRFSEVENMYKNIISDLEDIIIRNYPNN